MLRKLKHEPIHIFLVVGAIFIHKFVALKLNINKHIS